MGQHGPESVAFLSTGQIATEEMALLGALGQVRHGHVVHGDGNTRQCMATAVVAYKQAFGFDAPPYTYADFEESDVIVLVGANLCIAHPIMWERVMRNPHRPRSSSSIRARPRPPWPRRSTCALRRSRPDAALRRREYPADRAGWIDREFIDATRAASSVRGVRDAVHAERVAARDGLASRADRAVCPHDRTRGERVSFWWTMGVNQSHRACAPRRRSSTSR
jgi:predicted molibdopterin-dependent oxidoreductase YjgC